MATKKKLSLNALQSSKSHKVVGIQYIILAIFWLIFIAALVATVVIFISELNGNKPKVNDLINKINDPTTPATDLNGYYSDLLKIKYFLIDFSLINFIKFGTAQPTIDPAAAWTQRYNDINLAYSYVFITALIAIIGFVFYLVVIYKLFARVRFEHHYGFSLNFPSDYPIYDTKMYLGFVVNLAIVFGFFNFLTTIIVLLYGIILVLVSYFFWYILKIKTEVLVMHKWWKSPNFVLFLSIVLIQNGFAFVRTFFISEFGVDLNLILSILFPIGTITVMITLLIRNMLNTKVSAIKKAIKTINAKVSAFRIFYYTQKETSLEDYTFVSQLPPLVRIPLENNNVTIKEAYQLMTLINDAAKFFELHFPKEKERNYMLFHLFNEITQVEEIKEIEENVLKYQALKKK